LRRTRNDSWNTPRAHLSSQEAFADELGVHRTYTGGIERGERNLTLKSLERIAGRLKLDPLALLQGLEPPDDEPGSLVMPQQAPDAVALGRAIQAIRTERGMSQMQFAEATGFMQSWISQVERGRRNPSWNNVSRLADGLDVSLSERCMGAGSLTRWVMPLCPWSWHVPGDCLGWRDF
jgi:transcriptional regulator with XRE-family HTH domain